MLMIKVRSYVGILVLSGLLLGSISITSAQSESAPLNDGDFSRFITVNVELQKLAEQYEPVFSAQGEDDPEKRATLQRELETKTRDVLTKNNLTPEGYREIYNTVNADPQLRTKALLAIEERRKEDGKQENR
jgi:hypothetical protein